MTRPLTRSPNRTSHPRPRQNDSAYPIQHNLVREVAAPALPQAEADPIPLTHLRRKQVDGPKMKLFPRTRQPQVAVTFIG